MKTTKIFSAILAIFVMATMFISCTSTKGVTKPVVAVKPVKPVTELGEYVILTDSLFKEISKSPKKMDSVYWLPSEDIVLWRTRSISKDAVKDGTYFTGQDQIDTVVIRKKTIGLFVPDIKSNNLLNFVFDEDSLRLTFKKENDSTHSPYILNVKDNKVKYGSLMWNVSKGDQAIIIFDKQKLEDIKITKIAKGMKIGDNVQPIVIEVEKTLPPPATEEVKKEPPTQKKSPVRPVPFRK